MLFSYPPAAAGVLAGFYLIPKPLTVFLLSMMACFLTAGLLLRRKLHGEHLATGSAIAILLFFALSYPLWIEIQQANCEWLVWLILTIGLCAFLKDMPRIAAICIGLATAIKLYPVILLGLFLARRKYSQAALGIGTSVVATVASLWLESGSVVTSWKGTVEGMGALRHGYVLRLQFFWDHSLLALVKQIFVFGHSLLGGSAQSLSTNLPVQMDRFYVLACGLAGVVLFFTRIAKLPQVNQILALSVACVLVPPLSMDYTIIQLFLPCALLILIAIRSAKTSPEASIPGLQLALLLMAILFAPETELTFRGHTASNMLRTLALLALFIVSLRYPFESEVSALDESSVLADEDESDTSSQLLPEPTAAIR